MKDEVWRAFLPLIRKTFMQCGVMVVGLAVVIFSATAFHDGATAFHDDLAWVAGQVVQFITGPVFELVVWTLKAIGNLSYVVYVTFLAVYVWISCVWWKLKSVSSIQAFTKKLKKVMMIFGILNLFMIFVAMMSHSERLAFYLLAVFFVVAAKVFFVDLMPSFDTKDQSRDV